MKVLYVVFTIGLLIGRVFAQPGQTVSGIAQWQDGRLIAGATVELKDKKTDRVTGNVQTDANGEFRFYNVPAGTYLLKATLGALELASREITVGDKDLEKLLFVFSYQSGIDESVTIAIDLRQDPEQVSKTTDLVTGQQMRERADFTLVDTLRTIPGFRVQQLGGFGRTASIKSRGLRNQDTAVLIDGIRFRDPGSITGDASPFLSDFTLTSVSRIEVLRGSGSSLYGTNAIGATLDFQTPSPRSGLHGQMSGAAGGLGLGRFRGNISYGGDRFGLSAGVSRTAYTKGIDGEDNADNTNFQPRLDFNPTDNTTISGRFFVSDAQVRLNTSPDTLGVLPPVGTIIEARPGITFTPDVDDPDSIQRSRFFSGQFAATQVVNRGLIISGYYQGLATKRTNVDGPLGVGFQSAFASSFGGTVHTANVHAAWSPNEANTLTAGYEFEAERFRNEGSTPAGTDDFWTRAGQRSHTLYAQHSIGFLNKRLQIAGGVRAQWFSLDRPEFSETDGPYTAFTLSDPPAAYTFDGSASYFISTTGTKLRVHAGNGYRVPSLYERFGTFFFFDNFFPQGNPELKPEHSIGIDAGVEQHFLNDRITTSAIWFYTRIKDEITYLPTDDFGAPAYYNFDRHYSRGAEFKVDARPTRSTDIFASYTFTNSDIRNFSRPTIVSLDSRDRRSFGIPSHQFTLVVTQRIKRFWISADVLATSSYLAPIFSNTEFAQYTYRFKGNQRLDLTAGYTFPIRGDRVSLRLFGTVENLLDNEYFENGFRTVPRNGRVGLSLGF